MRLRPGVVGRAARVDSRQQVASFGFHRSRLGKRNVAITVNGSALVEGELRLFQRPHRLGPGGALTVAVSQQWLEDYIDFFFLATTFSFSATIAPTRADMTARGRRPRGTYLATDFRFDATFGRTFANVWSPYVSARVFGGPVVWWVEDEVWFGQDPEHHVLAIGSVFTLPKNWELGVDWGVTGARSLGGSVGVSF